MSMHTVYRCDWCGQESEEGVDGGYPNGWGERAGEDLCANCNSLLTTRIIEAVTKLKEERAMVNESNTQEKP